MSKLFNKIASFSVSAVAAFSIAAGVPMNALAAVANPAPASKVSFTFDEGYKSTHALAAPTLAKYGFSGTAYITTGCVGMTTVPNTCHANNDASYITWDQIAALKNTYKWEIGSHTVTHPYLASSDASDGQPNVLTPEQVRWELAQSKADLAARGYDATAFATPYGDYNTPVLAEIAKHYSSHRGFADTGYNVWPNSDYLVRVQQVQAGVSVSQVKGYVDNAIRNKQWLVLVFHDIKTNPSNNPDDYEYSNRNLDQIAAYIKSKNVPVVNPSSALVKNDVNLLPNSSFNNGIADGWTTDGPSNIIADGGNNGNYPGPTKSIKLVSGASTKHLFSPRVSVNPNANYVLKNYLHVKNLSSGEVGFYIDEYDLNGNWVSGQYKGAERSVFAESLNFTYKPTSAGVAKASLQVYVTGNSGITAYLDNVQWLPLSGSVTPPPAPTNLVANGTFDAGISSGWNTDSPTTITADNSNNGSPANPVNSVKLTPATSNKHLFSPKVAVDPVKNYSLSSYLNLKQRTGGSIGFYIDEYDLNGNWVSGQYKADVSAISAADVSFQYKPTSAAVAKASLQIIVTGNSGILAYFDHVRWYAL